MRHTSLLGAALTATLALTGLALPTQTASAQIAGVPSVGSPTPAAVAPLLDAATDDLVVPTREEARETLAEVKELATATEAGPSAATAHVQGRELTLALRDLRLARPALSRSEKRQADRLLTRPTDLTGDNLNGFLVALPLFSSDCTTSTRFCIHYASGREAQAVKVAGVMDRVYATLVGRLGYRAPLGDAAESGARGNPDGKFDVYLVDIGDRGYYGYCSTETLRSPRTASSYCVLDDDFAEFPGRADDSLKATAAHEFFHAIQFAYDFREDLWLMEGSAVWAEERVYDGVNDYLQYVRGDSAITRPAMPVDQDSVRNLRVYASMLFFEHLTQTLGMVRMRQVWEAAAGDAYSLQAIRHVVSRVTSWGGFVNRFAVWNSRPPGIGYAERGRFPQGKYVASRYLGLKGTRSMGVSLRRDHLASGAIRMLPARKSTRTQRLRIAINGPNTARGAVAAVQQRYFNGRTRWHSVRLNRAGNAVLVKPFGRGRVASVVITVANASTRMRDCGSNKPVVYSCGGFGAYNDLWRVSARVIR